MNGDNGIVINCLVAIVNVTTPVTLVHSYFATFCVLTPG